MPPVKEPDADTAVVPVLDDDDESKSDKPVSEKLVSEKLVSEEFIMPLEYERISAEFGWRTIGGTTEYNSGIDFAADSGTEIKAAASGTVQALEEPYGVYGKHLKILLDDGEITTLYAHCSKLLVKEGDTVKQGDVIAEVGSTGRATGPHLHFEVSIKDARVNPADYLPVENLPVELS